VRITLGRFYKDTNGVVWCMVAATRRDAYYLGVNVARDVVVDNGTHLNIEVKDKNEEGKLTAHWFTHEGICIASCHPNRPTVLRLVEMIVPSDPHAPGAVDQLGSLAPLLPAVSADERPF